MPDALINMDLDRQMNMRDIIKKVEAVGNVHWARLILGPDDAVAYIETANWLELETTIFKINSVEGVVKTDSRVLLPRKH